MNVPADPAGSRTDLAVSVPVTPVARTWVARVTLAGLGVWAGFFGPIQVLLAQQAEAVAPGDRSSSSDW